MFQVIESRVCQTCKFCTPQKVGDFPNATALGLFCDNPEVLSGQSSPTSIFWAVLKHCGEERTLWERQ